MDIHDSKTNLGPTLEVNKNVSHILTCGSAKCVWTAAGVMSFVPYQNTFLSIVPMSDLPCSRPFDFSCWCHLTTNKSNYLYVLYTFYSVLWLLKDQTCRMGKTVPHSPEARKQQTNSLNKSNNSLQCRPNMDPMEDHLRVRMACLVGRCRMCDQMDPDSLDHKDQWLARLKHRCRFLYWVEIPSKYSECLQIHPISRQLLPRLHPTWFSASPSTRQQLHGHQARLWQR